MLGLLGLPLMSTHWNLKPLLVTVACNSRSDCDCWQDSPAQKQVHLQLHVATWANSHTHAILVDYQSYDVCDYSSPQTWKFCCSKKRVGIVGSPPILPLSIRKIKSYPSGIEPWKFCPQWEMAQTKKKRLGLSVRGTKLKYVLLIISATAKTTGNYDDNAHANSSPSSDSGNS